MSGLTDRYNVLMEELCKLNSDPDFTEAAEDALLTQLDNLWDGMSLEEWDEVRKLHVC